MRKLFTIFPLCIVLCLLTGGCSTADANEENYEEEIATVSYDNNTDYMSLMVQYAAAGNMDALGAAVTARNEKIANQQLGYEQLSVDEFLNNYESYAGFSLDTDYMSQMVSCCLSGDVAGGLEAERLRNLKIDTLNLDVTKVSFNDLYLLSKIITSEAGSNWLSMEWKMMVGEVLLNRVASQNSQTRLKSVSIRPDSITAEETNTLRTSCRMKTALKLLCGCSMGSVSSTMVQLFFRQTFGRAVARTSNCMTSN